MFKVIAPRPKQCVSWEVLAGFCDCRRTGLGFTKLGCLQRWNAVSFYLMDQVFVKEEARVWHNDWVCQPQKSAMVCTEPRSS